MICDWKGRDLPRLVSARFDLPEAQRLAVARAHGAYATIGEPLFSRSAFELIELVVASGLRGRGGAGFPTGLKWRTAPRPGARPVFLAVNADESEPGTYKDRVLMERDPHLLLEGVIIAGYALGVRTAYIFVRGEMLPQIRILNQAIAECYEAGLLGERIGGSAYSLDVVVHRGAGAYICGEETGLLGALEGRLGQPRLKPPFPTQVGAFKAPTVINNVETLACLPYILREGAAAFRAVGTAKSPGSKLFAVSGDVRRPDVVEVPLGFPLLDLVDLCGGLDGELLGCIPGGSSMPVLSADECRRCTLDFECLQELKSGLGSGAVIPFSTRHDPVDLLHTLTRFYAHESCGQCTPCREGLGYAHRLLGEIAACRGREGDLAFLKDLADNFETTTICPLATACAWPIQSFLKKFPDAFARRLAASPERSAPRELGRLWPGGFM